MKPLIALKLPAKLLLGLCLVVSVAIVTASQAKAAIFLTVTSAAASKVNTTTGQVTNFSLNAPAFAVAVSRDGTKAYFAEGDPGPRLEVIRTSDLTRLALIPMTANANGLALSPDGNKAYVTSFAGTTLAVVNLQNNTGSPVTISGCSNPAGAALDPSGAKLFIACGGQTTLPMYDAASPDQAPQQISLGAGVGVPATLALAKSGRYLYVANSGNNSGDQRVDISTTPPSAEAIGTLITVHVFSM